MKRLGKWICQFDWDVFVGTALAFIFYIGVVSPALTGLPHKDHGQSQAQYDQVYQYISGAGSDDALARYTLWLVIFTAILAVSTIGLWIVTAKTLSHAQKDAARQASDAERQLAMAQRSLLASNRAWIRVEVGVQSPWVVTPPPGLSAISGSVALTLKNIGNVPAIDITMHAWLVAHGENPVPVALAIKCEQIRAQPRRMGTALFPDEVFPLSAGLGGYNLGVNISRDNWDRALAACGDTPPLYVMGCVDYTFPADPDGRHQTRFIFSLLRRLPNRDLARIGDTVGTIPGQDIMLSDETTVFGRYAD